MLACSRHPLVRVLPMSTHTPANYASELKRLVWLWPYILTAISLAGLAFTLLSRHLLSQSNNPLNSCTLMFSP